MYPELFRIGNFPITTFGLMMFLSFVGGAWILGKGMKRYGFSPDLAWDMLAWLAIGGVLGAKLYHLALNFDQVKADPTGMIFNRAGLVWYGGLIGGVTAYFVQIRARKLPLPVLFDACAPALFFGYAIGRMGCFLVGDDYGRATNAWYGIAFPKGSPATTAFNLRTQFGDDIPLSVPDSTIMRVHPTQLYEVGLALILFWVIWQLMKKRMAPGFLFACFMLFYAIERFFIEFVRAKSDRFVVGLTTSQVMSILLVIGAAVIWFTQKDKAPWDPKLAPAELKDKPQDKPRDKSKKR
jgi:phosphatidylglycerol:prolipoprotein diacylglycerol transferase